MSTGLESSARPRRSAMRRYAAFLLIAIRHTPGWILRIFFTLLILVAVLFAYLHLVGFPAYIMDGFMDQMASRGYFLQIRRLTLEIDRGLVAHDVRFFVSSEEPEPIAEADALAIAIQPGGLLRQRRIVPVVSLINGSIHLPMPSPHFKAQEGLGGLRLHRIHFRLTATPQAITLRDFSGVWQEIQFRGRGMVFLSPEETTRAAPEPPPLRRLVDMVQNVPDPLRQTLEFLNEITYHEAPSAEFTFAIYPSRPAANTGELRLTIPAGGKVKTVVFDYGRLALSWKEQQLQVSSALLRAGNESLGLSGWYDSVRQTASLHLVNTLPLETFLALLSQHFQIQAQSIATQFRFPWRLELQAGPAPLATLGEQFSGRLTLSGAVLRDIPVEALDFHFAREGDTLQFGPASVQLDTGPKASRLAFQTGSYHFPSRQFRAEIAGKINPHLLKSLMTPGIRSVVEWFGITDPVEGELVVGGTVGNPAIYCWGPVRATNFTVNGVPVQSFQGHLMVTNEVMYLTRAVLHRPEGQIRGEVQLAFSNQTIYVDLDSSVEPRAITQMLGPEVAQFFQPFRMEGPTTIQMRGRIDFYNFSLNHFQARVKAQRFGYERWESEQAEFDLAARGRRFYVTNALAWAYGGQLSGAGSIYPVGGDHRWRYELEYRATNISLTNLLWVATDKPPENLRGTLDGAGQVGGYLGPHTGAEVVGTGYVQIRGGHLFQTRLFSGLTAILSKVIPEFNLFAQTDATAAFTLHGGRLISRNIELQGTVFSIKALGSYTFAGDLDYRVEVQLLRGGPVATLVRLATRPVTRLLEFRLTGSFEDPRWRPLNLNPLELFQSDTKGEG